MHWYENVACQRQLGGRKRPNSPMWDSLGISGPEYMRTRGAARAGAAPRALNPAASPTLIVGATHGRGSEPIAGKADDKD